MSRQLLVARQAVLAQETGQQQSLVRKPQVGGDCFHFTANHRVKKEGQKQEKQHTLFATIQSIEANRGKKQTQKRKEYCQVQFQQAIAISIEMSWPYC